MNTPNCIPSVFSLIQRANIFKFPAVFAFLNLLFFALSPVSAQSLINENFSGMFKDSALTQYNTDSGGQWLHAGCSLYTNDTGAKTVPANPYRWWTTTAAGYSSYAAKWNHPDKGSSPVLYISSGEMLRSTNYTWKRGDVFKLTLDANEVPWNIGTGGSLTVQLRDVATKTVLWQQTMTLGRTLSGSSMEDPAWGVTPHRATWEVETTAWTMPPGQVQIRLVVDNREAYVNEVSLNLGDLCPLPYSENFAALIPGALGTQLPARATPTASANIVLDDTDSENPSNHVLAVTATTPPGEVFFPLLTPSDFGNVLWFETRIKATATEGHSQVFDLDGMLISLVKNAAGTGAQFHAYDGKLGLANGSGTWKAIGDPFSISELQLSAFARVTLRADYTKHKYDVFLNGRPVAANLGFDDATIARPTSLALYGQTSGTNYFDDIYLSGIAPESVPFSTVGDGIADVWKTANGIQITDTNVRDSDSDGNGLTLLEEYFYGLAPGAPARNFLGKHEIPGGFYREVWQNISGNYLSKLKAATNDFQKAPDAVSLTKGAEAPENWAENYGQRIRGYVTLPEVGTYNFYLTGDDTAELYISPDGTKWHAVKAATVPWNSGGTNNWTKHPSQRSTDYTLPAGHKLYVEIRHKEGIYADYARLGWTTPSNATPVLVPAAAISSYVLDINDQDDDDLPDDWERSYNLDTNDNGLTNPANGKHGTNNTAGLDNYLCYKLGLDPRTPDISALVGKVNIPGVLQREVWTDLNGSYISDLLTNTKFSQTPDKLTFTPPEGFSDDGINYGERWRGWLTAPISGTYQLLLSSDDAGQLWFSPDDTVAAKRYVARVVSAVGRYANSQPKQTTLPLELVAGQRYYIEVLHKQGPGAAHCELSWTTPEDGTFAPIPGEHLSSWVNDDAYSQIGYSKAWINRHNLGANSLLPSSFFLPTSYLTNWQSYRLDISPAATLQDLAPLAQGSTASGAWIRETWESGLVGTGIAANLALYAAPPTQRQVVKGGDDFATQIADYHVDRTRGYLVPPATGWYRLALSSDDDGELWLSTDATVSNARCIAHVTYSPWNDFLGQGAQLSAPIYLETGKRYYTEVRHYEYGGEDFVQLVWATPTAPAELVSIPASAMSVYVPPADDPNGWGYPTAWLISTGLNNLSGDKQNPWADPTGGGLTNLEKYKLGLNPLSLDTDGDGVSDYEEVYLSHTNPALADFDGTVTTIVTINGADFLPSNGGTGSADPPNDATGTIGNWQKTGTSAYAADIRGTLAYAVTIPASSTLDPRPLRLAITGGQYITGSTDKVLALDVYVDSGYAGRVALDLTKPTPLDLGLTTSAEGILWLPQLTTGTHQIRLAWLNGTAGTSLRIDSLALQTLGGTWLITRQNALSQLDETPAVSYTSPYCLEGGAQDAEKLTIGTSYIPAADDTDTYSTFIRENFFGATAQDPAPKTQALAARTALRGKFYSDHPLSPTTPTTTTVSDDTTGSTHSKTVTWLPYDLAAHAGETLYLRTGDALLLKSAEAITVTSPSGALTLSPSDALPFVFAQPGTYQIFSGAVQITVHAISADLNTPTALLNQTRRWTPPNLPDEARLLYDEQLHIADISRVSGKRSLSLLSTLTADQYVIARLGETGPILTGTRVNTLVSYGNPSGTWDIVAQYDDGSRLWRGQLNFGGNIPDDFRIVIDVYRAGVTFDDGTALRTITKADLDANGTYTYYLLHGPGPDDADGAVCHRIKIYDGDQRITVFER